MALPSGARLGPYEILSPLGAGGMGEVYRATDTNLKRQVAVKVLPQVVADDPDRLARFQREAELLAALNHPNIAHIHGLERSERALALVMELVEGPTLADRLAQGAMPLEEVLPIAKQIADALEAAHEQGIIHRDLKPANIKVRADGVVKVLDFGLAKAMAPASSHASAATSPTISVHATREGIILGTVAYMSPEQARGRTVDRRTDVWAFGAVLFEMLTGARAFDAEDVSATIAFVITKEPDWSALPSATPAAIRKLLRRCLEKDPKRRLRDISDARLEIDDAMAAPAAEAVPVAAPGASRPRAWLWPGIAGLLAVATGAAVWTRPSPVALPSARLAITLPAGQELTSYPAITRDGRTIAYTARHGLDDSQLYLRDLTSFEARAVPGSGGARQPFFSPDARWVGFFAQGHVQKAEVAGGAPVRLADAPSPMGGTWTENGTIIYSPSLGAGLLRIPAAGGAPETISTPDGGARGYAHVFPFTLPGNAYLAFSVWGQTQGVSVLPLAPGGGDWSLVLPLQTFSGGVFASTGGPEGHLFVVTRESDVKAAAFNAARPSRVSADASVLSGVYLEEETESGPWLAVSNTGTAVYAAASPSKTSLAFVDHEGKAEPLDAGQDMYREVRLSADGSRAVVRHQRELWIHDLRRQTRSRLAAPAGSSNLWPSWSREGTHVIFASNRGGDWDIYSQPADGSTPAERVLQRRFDQFPVSVAADGTILFVEIHPQTARDLWTLSPDGQTTMLRASSANESAGQWRPGREEAPRWIAYSSDESGRPEVYLQSVRGSVTRFPVSSAGGVSPQWSHDGAELYYVTGEAVVAVPVGPDGTVGAVRQLFDRSDYHFRYNVQGWSPAPDGKRFLMIRRDEGSIPRQLNVILNWFADLDALAAPAGR
jgi:Tol biopolymer transport system component